MIKKIIIFNNFIYSGGPLVLSKLCASLRDLGYDARLYMHPYVSIPGYNPYNYIREMFWINVRFHLKRWICGLFPNSKFLDRYRVSEEGSYNMEGLKFQLFPFYKRKETIVIYPDYIYGNPLFSKNVCRWLLYHYQFENDKDAYKKDDLFVAYREVFNIPSLNPLKKISTILVFDNKRYRQYNFKERQGKCYILRKGKYRKDLPTKFDGPVFDDNMSQQELVELFNTHKYCYSYDLQTFYTTIAAVCGCIPIEVPEEGKSISDYRCKDELHHPGIAWGDKPEEIQHAIDTREELLNSLDYDEFNKRNSLHFINLLEEHFGQIQKYK